MPLPLALPLAGGAVAEALPFIAGGLLLGKELLQNQGIYPAATGALAPPGRGRPVSGAPGRGSSPGRGSAPGSGSVPGRAVPGGRTAPAPPAAVPVPKRGVRRPVALPFEPGAQPIAVPLPLPPPPPTIDFPFIFPIFKPKKGSPGGYPVPTPESYSPLPYRDPTGRSPIPVQTRPIDRRRLKLPGSGGIYQVYYRSLGALNGDVDNFLTCLGGEVALDIIFVAADEFTYVVDTEFTYRALSGSMVTEGGFRFAFSVGVPADIKLYGYRRVDKNQPLQPSEPTPMAPPFALAPPTTAPPPVRIPDTIPPNLPDIYPGLPDPEYPEPPEDEPGPPAPAEPKPEESPEEEEPKESPSPQLPPGVDPDPDGTDDDAPARPSPTSPPFIDPYPQPFPQPSPAPTIPSPIPAPSIPEPAPVVPYPSPQPVPAVPAPTPAPAVPKPIPVVPYPSPQPVPAVPAPTPAPSIPNPLPAPSTPRPIPSPGPGTGEPSPSPGTLPDDGGGFFPPPSIPTAPPSPASPAPPSPYVPVIPEQPPNPFRFPFEEDMEKKPNDDFTPPPFIPEAPKPSSKGKCKGNACNESIESAAQGAQDIGKEIFNKVDKLAAKLEKYFQVLDVGLLIVINDKLGPKIPGGLSKYIERIDKITQSISSTVGAIQEKLGKFAKWARLGQLVSVLTLITSLHNALMLSRNLGETLLSMLSNGLAVFGIKDDNNNPYDLSSLIGSTVESTVKATIGTENYTTLSTGFKKANRIYQAAANLGNSIQSLRFSVTSALETIGGWNARIGNALKRSGVVNESSYAWMNPNPNFDNKFTRALETVENTVSQIDSVASEILSAQETVTQIASQKDELANSLGLGTEKAQTDNKQQKDKAIAAKTASAAPNIEATDLNKPGV